MWVFVPKEPSITIMDQGERFRAQTWCKNNYYYNRPLVEDPGDNEYLVTADMLIHEDMDDERTLEEEEGAWSDEGNDQEELQDLQKVQFDYWAWLVIN